MKKLILICLFVLLALPLSAQVQSSVSRFNSTAQELDSAGVYTGTAEVVTGFTSISVTIRADSSGSYLVLFGNGSTLTNATAYKIYSMNYIAGDTAHTRTFPVVAPYFKIIYTTTATDTSNLYIVTMLHRDGVAPQTTDAKLDVSVSTLPLPSGAATSDKQDSTITLLNSQLLKLLNISANSDLLIPSTSIKTVFRPATTSTDSVVFGFTSRRITIINDGVATDTLEISNSNLFPSTSTYIRTGGEAMSKNIALQKIYIRKKSGSASNYRLEVE